MSSGAKCDLFYGQTKTTKTSQIGKAAKYFHSKTGKPLLLYSADNGGWDTIEDLVDAGIVVAISIRHLPFAPEAIDKLSQGWIVEGDKVIPAPTGYWSKFSAIAFEGLASFGEWCMDYYAQTGQKLGMNQSYSNIKIGSTIYHGVSQDHYGDVQSRLIRCVVNSSRIPVGRAIWTSLEAKGKDEITGMPLIGPALVGNKKVDRAGQYFGNLIHLDFVEEAATAATGGKIQVSTARPVMFLRTHPDPITKMNMSAGTRALADYASEVPAYLDPPDAGRLYKLLDDLKEKAAAKLKKEVQ